MQPARAHNLLRQALKKEHERLGREIAGLAAKEPKAAPVEDDPCVTITYPVPVSTLVVPSDDELQRLEVIALEAYPSLAPKIELSFVERLTVRKMGVRIEPDAEGIAADFSRQFRGSFFAIGAMKLLDAPDHRHYIGHRVETAQAWLKSFNLHANISSNAFLVAALMHGIPFTYGSREFREPGAV